MDSNRDSRKPQATTTPVFGGASRSVYRSLAAAPSAAPFSVYRDPAGVLERPSKIVGPQTKGPGDVVWLEQKVQQKGNGGELLPCPIPLIVAHAPHQSLFVESNPVTKVVNAVHELFQQHQVDIAYNADKFKWKCMCYAAEGVETRFVARLFSVPEKAGFFVLDFQRRSGDAFHFQSLYKAMHFRLLKTGFVVCNDSKAEQMRAEEPVMRTFKPLPLPSDLLGQVDECEPLDFSPIFRMCNSQYIDVQREGLAALASQLAEADERSQTTALPIIERLMELLSLTRDAQVRRLAMTALARLSILPQSHEKLSEKGAVQLLVKVTLHAEEVVETRRQACQALAQLPRRVLDESLLSALRAAQNCADMRLAQLIQSVVA